MSCLIQRSDLADRESNHDPPDEVRRRRLCQLEGPQQLCQEAQGCTQAAGRIRGVQLNW